MEAILHHYDYSSFSEKVRLMLGRKGLRWRSVDIPAYGPKPLYTPLTAGYRRTPALQFGADIYCDTRLIALELERRVPLPPLFPTREKARERALLEVLVAWAEQPLFRPLALTITGQHAERFPAAFHADRAALHGKPVPSLAQLAAAARQQRAQCELQLRFIEGLLGAGQDFMLGEDVSVADFSIYSAPWFLETIGGRSALLDGLPLTRAWMTRVAAIGHGHPQPMTPAEALAIAAAHAPLACASAPGGVDEDVALGDEVRVAALDQRAEARGTLRFLDDERITLVHSPAGLGEIASHFPRLGYRLSRVRA